MKNLVKKYPLFFYFTLAILISWVGVVWVVGADRLVKPGPTDEQMPLLILIMCAGPSIAGVSSIWLCDGMSGLQDFKKRLLKWRVNFRWYAIALLTALVLILAVLFALSLVDMAYYPDFFASDEKAALLIFGTLGGFTAGFFEEIGWTGFAIPRLRQRHGIMATGLICGVIWGLWHMLVFLSGDPSGKVPAMFYLPVLLFTHLPVYRILMVWLHDRTNSLFINILMHTSLTVCTLTIATVSGVAGVIYSLALTAVLWVVVLIVVRSRSTPGEKSRAEALANL